MGVLKDSQAVFYSICMKFFVSVLLLVCVGSSGQMIGQSLEEQFTSTPGKSGGVYFAYPSPDTVILTSPPTGYKPFYISHYGRHGSRYLLSDNDYLRLIKMLEKADSAQMLTDIGLNLLSRSREIWEEAKGHTDELAPLGKRQHRGIAERMLQSYPEVFAQHGQITARSTTSLRCVLSMFAFCERIKELNSEIYINWNTSKKDMFYLNWHSDEYNTLKKDPEGWMKDFRKFCSRPGLDPTRFVSQIIRDTAYFHRNHEDPRMLMTAVYDVASDLQDMETELRMYDLFTPSELVECWRNGNAWFYYSDANAKANKGMSLSSCRHLVNNIIEQADSAIAGKGDIATLRFGHDGNIIPLAACLHLKNCDACIEDAFRIEDVWRNYEVSPMAANIQLVFYKKLKFRK